MLNTKMEAQLNDQLNFELYSSYLYLSMSADFKTKAFNGFGNWMQVQAQEELVHVMGFHYYILSRGGKPVMKKIDAPGTSWDSPLSAFSETLKHEMIVTSRINALAKLAVEESDFASSNFLQWYVSEQVEEEANASEIVNQLKMAGDSKQGVFMLDRELSARTFSMSLIPGGMPAPPAA
jgi:ferritin